MIGQGRTYPGIVVRGSGFFQHPVNGGHADVELLCHQFDVVAIPFQIPFYDVDVVFAQGHLPAGIVMHKYFVAQNDLVFRDLLVCGEGDSQFGNRFQFSDVSGESIGEQLVGCGFGQGFQGEVVFGAELFNEVAR